ncbi:MAG: V-type ATPase subunit [Candidatus Bathyarchaeota archaeon]|nr:V-type ATPase subunit [Candidatus Bathyarchaeota archaeon]
MTQTSRYASVLALIGAERSRILSESKIKALAENMSLSEFATQLHDTIYQEKISKLSLPLTSRKLERAFNETLLDTEIKIIKKCPKQAANYLSMYLLKVEVENIKALIKATAAKQNPEERASKIYVSVEHYFKNHALIEDAAKSSDLQSLVVSLKGSPFYSALRFGLEFFEETGSTVGFDVHLDKEFYERFFEAYCALPKKEQSYAKVYAIMEYDGYVLLSLLRGKYLGYGSNWLRLAVPNKTFNLSKDVLEDIISAEDFDSALSLMQKTEYKKFFSKAATPEEAVSNAERNFKSAILEDAKGRRIGKLFNIGVPLSFMVQKQVEAHNLSIISLGIEGEQNPEDILHHLNLIA